MATLELPLYHVDAFASRPFEGNPAAVCPLARWLPDRLLQAIAEENKLSETAFLVGQDAGTWKLRWFTPTDEVDLCGHATLASAYVVCEHLKPGRDTVTFETASGPLEVRRQDGRYAMQLPARPPEPLEGEAAMAVETALRSTPERALAADKIVAVLSNATEVQEAAPDLARVEALEGDGLIVTAPGDDCDFVSRYFAPHVGIPEDPVTGSAHCVLVPYWAERLGRTELSARQLSTRGGELGCRLEGGRIELVGEVAPYLTGTVRIPE